MSEPGPASPSSYCRVCGLAWQVNGCTKETCATPAAAPPARIQEAPFVPVCRRCKREGERLFYGGYFGLKCKRCGSLRCETGIYLEPPPATATPSPAAAEPPTRHPNESTGDFCRRVADWAGVAVEQKTQEDR